MVLNKIQHHFYCNYYKLLLRERVERSNFSFSPFFPFDFTSLDDFSCLPFACISIDDSAVFCDSSLYSVVCSSVCSFVCLFSITFNLLEHFFKLSNSLKNSVKAFSSINFLSFIFLLLSSLITLVNSLFIDFF